MTLKPCPFCGCAGVYLVRDHDDDRMVECGGCTATGPCEATEAGAVAAWNRALR